MEYIRAQHSCYMLLPDTPSPALILPLDPKFQNAEALATSSTKLTQSALSLHVLHNTINTFILILTKLMH